MAISSSIAVESLPVHWELALITFRLLGVDRNTLTVAEVRSHSPYRRFVLSGFLGIAFLALGLVVWAVAVWLIPLEQHSYGATTNPFARSLALTGRLCILGGALIWLVSGLMFRVASQARNRAIAEVEAKLTSDPALPDIDQKLEQRDAYEDGLFERNLKDAFLVRSFTWNGLNFLEDGEYRLASRVNVLLGKNGYGKTLLFRTLAATIRRDRDTLRRLAKMGNPKLKLEIIRNGNTEEVLVDKTRFRDNIGGIPLLAIPDSRFINRSKESVAGAATGNDLLSPKTGAKHFLTQQPYEDVIQELLTQLVLDYLSNKNGLDQPIFRLIESVVRELTDDAEFAFDTIERSGRSTYTILMRSGANRDTPLPLQTASQGTLSILAIFGLIYSFLHSLNPDTKPEELVKAPAIVIIDEVDAHLHPSWQQKIMALLTSRFPNVQFIVSGHSPVIVAGCDRGEVSVLRRPKEAKGFKVERLTEDFLGATARDLYQKVFEIEDVDRLYLEYSAKTSLSSADENELARLAKKEDLSASDKAKLLQLERESRLINRAADARQGRLKSEDSEAAIAQLKSEIARLKARVAELSSKVGGSDRVQS